MEKSQKMKILDIKDVPAKIRKRRDQWLQVLLKIPPGKAWAVTEEEAGIKAASLKMMVYRLQKVGELPASYKSTIRTHEGKVTLYVLNCAKTDASREKSAPTKM